MNQQRETIDMRERVYGFLAQTFRCAPTLHSLKVLAESATPQAEAFGLTSADTDFEAMRRELEAEFNKLFLGMSSYAISPYESVFTSPDHLLMQDARDQVRNAYRAEGVEIATEDNLPEDHIAFELGFMQHLCAKTREALQEHDEQEAQRLMSVQKDFFAQHLNRWVAQLCSSIAERAQSTYYQQVGKSLAMLMEEESELFS